MATPGGYTNKYDQITPLQGQVFGGTQQAVGFGPLMDIINQMTNDVKSQLGVIRSKRSAMSIADMFDLQLMMNKLSQVSEMSTSVVTSMQTSIMSLARNMKG